MEKDEAGDYTSLVMNKKLAQTMNECFTADPFQHCPPHTCALKFTADQSEIKTHCFGYQLSVISSEHSDVNHTAFCFSDVRAIIRGDFVLAGLLYQDMDGANIQAKMQKLSELSLADVSNSEAFMPPVNSIL